MNAPQQPPGWYQDPEGPGQRYWDGVQWTEQRAPHQQKSNTGRNCLIAGLVILGVIVVGVVGCVALVGTSTTTDEPDVEKGSGNGGGGGGSGGKVASVGDRLTLTGTTYQVTKVKTASRVGDQYTGTKASGRFVVVTMCLTNRKEEPATISEDAMRLIGGNGKNYSTSDEAIAAFPDQTFLLEEIQPDNKECGKLVYDIPRGAVSGSKIEVSDLFSDSKGQIKLGL